MLHTEFMIRLVQYLPPKSKILILYPSSVVIQPCFCSFVWKPAVKHNYFSSFFCICLNAKSRIFSLNVAYDVYTVLSGEFDDLVSALRTGDIFGDDIAKMKRNRRRVGANISTSRERVSDDVRL